MKRFKKINFIVTSIYSYLLAKLGPKADKQLSTARMETCSSCSWRVKKEHREYCSKCGCFQSKYWPDAELKTKTTFLYSKCPKELWQR